MNFAFSSNGFRKYSLLETIRILAELGYDGIEIMADTPHAFPLHTTPAHVAEIKRALDERGLAVANVNAFMHHAGGDTYHPTWIEEDPAERARRVDYTLRAIDLAADLGAVTISTEPGGPLDGMDAQDCMDRFLAGLEAVAPRARERGVRVLIEPEPGLLIEKSGQFLDIYRNLDSAVFGLNFDIGHFFCVGEDPVALVSALREATHHFHLEDIAGDRCHHHLMLGEGAVPIAETLEVIAASDYNGFVTVELYTYEDAPVEAARAAIQYLRRWEKQGAVRNEVPLS